MTDFDYDAMQKKRIASGDRHRKRGSKSKYCGLPSDHMTQAQWKKRNGEVKTMNLGKPMSWKEFKALPDDLAREYVQKCCDEFSMTIVAFADLFQVHRVTVLNRFDEIGVDRTLFAKGHRQTKDQKARFKAWVTQDDPISERPIENQTEPQPSAANPFTYCSHMELTFDNEIPYVDLATLLHEFSKGRPVSLRVIVDVKE